MRSIRDFADIEYVATGSESSNNRDIRIMVLHFEVGSL
jgi:hypothetical protein